MNFEPNEIIFFKKWVISMLLTDVGHWIIGDNCVGDKMRHWQSWDVGDRKSLT